MSQCHYPTPPLDDTRRLNQFESLFIQSGRVLSFTGDGLPFERLPLLLILLCSIRRAAQSQDRMGLHTHDQEAIRRRS